MGLFEHFPYTNFHDLNLDVILQRVKSAETAAASSAEDAAASAAIAQGLEDQISAAVANSANAVSAASNAVSTANTAASNASTALSTANTAASNASTALSTANTAASNAATALSTANTAASNAATAVTSAASSASSAESAATSAAASATSAESAATSAAASAASAEAAAENADMKVFNLADNGQGEWIADLPYDDPSAIDAALIDFVTRLRNGKCICRLYVEGGYITAQMKSREVPNASQGDWRITLTVFYDISATVLRQFDVILNTRILSVTATYTTYSTGSYNIAKTLVN